LRVAGTSSSHFDNVVSPICKRSFSKGLQDKDWQLDISLDGLTDSDTSDAKQSSSEPRNVSKRGGKVVRRQRELEEKVEKNKAQQSDTQFPTLRFSDEETERLLKEAYAGIPPRTGKRGTRNLRRQKNKFKIIRNQHKIKKQELVDAHFAKMAKRSRIAQEVKVIKEGADFVRENDREYHLRVLKKWSSMKSELYS